MMVLVRTIKALTTCVVIALSGCYEVAEPIITPEMAVIVPGLEGEITGSEGDRYVFEYNAQSRTYSISHRSGGSLKVEHPHVLAFPLRDNFYWFQIRESIKGGAPRFLLILSKYESAKKNWTEFHVPDMTEEDLHAFAARFDVKITRNDSINKLIGSRINILEFMNAHGQVQLKELHGP